MVTHTISIETNSLVKIDMRTFSPEIKVN
jgi:hypothetical protein